MAIHMVTRVAGEEFDVTLTRDDAGNYVAEAARRLGDGFVPRTETPRIRVVHPMKERAWQSLLDLLRNERPVEDRAPTGGP
ncbi:MAG TPA: hypothetical protein VFG59_00140 [Anaeromyxobacter sp.]|nr:hypothetical protein [Anaeromyxobacter sp.]